jgi:predicted esterase
MKQKNNTLLVNKTAHYYTLGIPGTHIRRLIIALHGYGQAARTFIHHFKDLIGDGETLVVCPEGLNRFYWKGFTGEVVASWMTKENREFDIRDNMAYLNDLYAHLMGQLPKDTKVTLLAFSQGCPTMSRWVAKCRPEFHHLILWGGHLAHDVDYAPSGNYFSDKELLFVYGESDQFLPFGYRERQAMLAKVGDLDFRTISFDGKHEIPRTVLGNILKELH